VPIGLYVV